MELGIVGLGRMGANIARRLVQAGHRCVVFDVEHEAVAAVARDGVTGATSLGHLVSLLEAPRTIWIMVPAANVETIVEDLVEHVDADDVIIDGGNSYYRDAIARAERLRPLGIHFVDVGTSGGVLGLERGYCLMIGGDDEPVRRLEPILSALAPGVAAATRTRVLAEVSSAERGFLHCGGSGAGHFVKMVHNGIEYGLMAAYAEGLNVLHAASVGTRERPRDAKTPPPRDPRSSLYDFDLPAITELWRRGSVISSWLLDLTALALAQSRNLEEFGGQVADSGEGRWTLMAAIEAGVPVHVLSAALFDRFESRGEASFANRVITAMRKGFGGHEELED